jgi:oligopeptidase B
VNFKKGIVRGNERIKEDDESAPIYTRPHIHPSLVKGKGLSHLFSKEREPSAKEEIMFDCNELAKEKNIHPKGLCTAH